MCNFLPRDLHQNVIYFKDILIKCAFPIDFNVKLDAGVMEAITKGPAFGDGKLLHMS